MKKVTKKLVCLNGQIIRAERDMYELLNYNIQRLLNKAERTGILDMPVLYCNTDTYPDYIVNYNQPGSYNKTSKTAVAFYQYDNSFDTIDGIYWAIYFGDEKQLDYYRKRLKDVKYIMGQDLSVFGDIARIENYYRIFRARVVCLWMTLELNAVIIPNVSYGNIEEMPIYISGLERCSVVSISAKSHVKYSEERQLFIEVIRYLVEHLKLKAIIVYSVCGKDDIIYEMCKYAIESGIDIIIPQNTLRERNGGINNG